jgi:lysophospholipase
MVEESHGYFEGVGGLRLFYRAGKPKAPRGRLLVLHGLGEHSGRYWRLAVAASSAGFAFYALDLRGHGKSQGRRGHVRSFDHLLQDTDRFRRRVGGVRSGEPTFVLGHSLGGLIVGRYIQEFSFPGLHGAILVAPAIQVAMDLPAWKQSLGAVTDRVMPALTLDNGLREEELFREDSERQKYGSDPLVHHRISARLWGEMQRNAAILGDRAGQVRLPVLFQLPGDDRVVKSEASRVVAGRMAGNTDVRVYPGAFHALYHDPESEHGLSDLVAWLDGQAAPPADR